MLIHITYILSQTTTTMDNILRILYYIILFTTSDTNRDISYKHDILFHHELSNDLRLRIPEPTVSSPMDGPLSQHKKKKTHASSPSPSWKPRKPEPPQISRPGIPCPWSPLETAPPPPPSLVTFFLLLLLLLLSLLINLITMRPLTQLHCKLEQLGCRKKFHFALLDNYFSNIFTELKIWYGINSSWKITVFFF